MTQVRTQVEQNAARDTERKPYVRPQLVQHGNVEAQTQGVRDSSSCITNL